jgi:hypothetical protein
MNPSWTYWRAICQAKLGHIQSYHIIALHPICILNCVQVGGQNFLQNLFNLKNTLKNYLITS